MFFRVDICSLLPPPPCPDLCTNVTSNSRRGSKTIGGPITGPESSPHGLLTHCRRCRMYVSIPRPGDHESKEAGRSTGRRLLPPMWVGCGLWAVGLGFFPFSDEVTVISWTRFTHGRSRRPAGWRRRSWDYYSNVVWCRCGPRLSTVTALKQRSSCERAWPGRWAGRQAGRQGSTGGGRAQQSRE